MMIPYGRQSISSEDIDAVISALNGDFLTTGPLVEEFERKLEGVTGAPTFVVSSGTAALHCAYAALDLKPGDEVITPPITFVATQATAALLGAKIVFADVQESTGNIDPVQARKMITDKTRAIVAVDYAGHPADLDELREICDEHEILLIEDAAHSIGSTYKSRKVGSIADLTTFSFFPTKNMTTAEGGAVSSPHPDLLEKAKLFARQGLIRDSGKFKILTEGPWHQEVHNFGLNYRLPDVLCALGITQLSQLAKFKSRRQEIFDIYTEKLSSIPQITLPIQKENVSSMWHLFPIRVNPANRESIFSSLREAGIFVQVNYLPAYRHPVFNYRNDSQLQFPVSEAFYASEISLPMYFELSDEQIHEICSVLNGIITN